MSTNTQTEKNIKLSHKLTNYLIKHPDISDKLPSNVSFVLYALHDKELNEANEKLIPELIEEGKAVIKVNETSDKNNPWTFIPVAA